jgi:hypothetical protein
MEIGKMYLTKGNGKFLSEEEKKEVVFALKTFIFRQHSNGRPMPTTLQILFTLFQWLRIKKNFMVNFALGKNHLLK